MRKNIFALAFLGLSLCVSAEYFIEISPHNEPNHYEVKLGDIVRFEVTGYYKKADDSRSTVSLEQKIWWDYDKRLLEKISSDTTSIRLKAAREGTTWLCATTLIKNQHCQKKISISIIK